MAPRLVLESSLAAGQRWSAATGAWQARPSQQLMRRRPRTLARRIGTQDAVGQRPGKGTWLSTGAPMYSRACHPLRYRRASSISARRGPSRSGSSRRGGCRSSVHAPWRSSAGRAWRYSSRWRLPPSATMRSDGSRPVPRSTGRRRSLTGSGDPSLGLSCCRVTGWRVGRGKCS